jgi:hypothetical protein
VKNIASNVDNKVKQYQDTLHKLKLALQEDTTVHTEIPLLWFLNVCDLCESSNFVPFPRLIQLVNS